ncbi:MAG: prepilin-type N-terminal cleavage/methylation domain-containing protein [Nitrospirae bacterium]|nr:prepilin-type N-terminal cleavage/methylation domain-containing protein [Nitrospirota bacterium]
MSKFLNNKGFTLVEIFVVMTIISILAAIAIPTYIGIRDSAKVSFLQSKGNMAAKQLNQWVLDVTGANDGNCVDTNFDGTINSNDLTCSQIITNGFSATYVAGRNALNTNQEKSPWDSSIQLWTTNSATPSGQISISEDNLQITIQARDNKGNTVYQSTVTK